MSHDDEARLPSSVGFIRIPPAMARSFGDFAVDPEIPIPVELAGGERDLSGLGWEMIVAGMLRLLAYEPDNAHADYYRRFALAVKPDIYDELAQTGAMKARNGELELAEEIFKALAGLKPDRPEPVMNLALLFEERADSLDKLGKEELADAVRAKAHAGYKKLLAMDPPFADGYYNAAYFYLKTRNYERARELFEFYAGLGEDEERTRKAAEIAAKLGARGNADALFKEAYDFIRMGREAEGVEKAEAFIKANPEVWNGWFLTGWAKRRLGDWAGAREAFLKALGLGADEVDLLNELAICEMELGLLKESRGRLEAALRKEPDNLKIVSNLGVVARRQGRLDEAAGFFRTVLALDPGDRLAAEQLSELEAI